MLQPVVVRRGFDGVKSDQNAVKRIRKLSANVMQRPVLAAMSLREAWRVCIVAPIDAGRGDLCVGSTCWSNAGHFGVYLVLMPQEAGR